MDDASIRDFNEGIGCHVASTLEQTLLLPKDMVELRGFRRSEVFLHTKRLLGMVCIPSPSPILQVEEEEEEGQEEKGFVDLIESTDDFEVFNQLSPPKNMPEEMGIQRKPQRSLQELLESQPGRGEAGEPTQPKLPPPPPRSPPRAPQLPPPSRIEQVDPKRRREPKGKKVMETGRPRPTNEEEAHRASKQQKTSHAPSRGAERADTQFP